MSSSSASAEPAPAPVLGTMNLTLRLLKKELMPTVVLDITEGGHVNETTQNEEGILTIRGTLDRAKVFKSLKKHKKIVVIQRVSGST